MVAEPSVTVREAEAVITDGTARIGSMVTDIAADISPATEISNELARKTFLNVNTALDACQVNFKQFRLIASQSNNALAEIINKYKDLEDTIMTMQKHQSRERPEGTRDKIDDKSVSTAVGMLKTLGKERHEYIDWNVKLINAIGWMNRFPDKPGLGRKFKEVIRTMNLEWSSPGFETKYVKWNKDPLGLDPIFEHSKDVIESFPLKHEDSKPGEDNERRLPHTFQDEGLSDVEKKCFVERFWEMGTVLDYIITEKTVGDNAVRARKSKNSWSAYYGIHRWFTEATGVMVQ